MGKQFICFYLELFTSHNFRHDIAKTLFTASTSYSFSRGLRLYALLKKVSLIFSQRRLSQLRARCSLRCAFRISPSLIMDSCDSISRRSSHDVRRQWRWRRSVARVDSKASTLKSGLCWYSQSSDRGQPCVQQGWSPIVTL